MGNAADKKRLRSVAKMLREELRHNAEDTPIHCWRRLPLRPSNTDGWFVVLAGLGRGRPKLQLWLDHYAERRERRFWFGFYSPHPKGLRQRIRRLPHYLQPVREFSSNDVEHVGKDNWLLAIPLKRMDF